MPDLTPDEDQPGEGQPSLTAVDFEPTFTAVDFDPFADGEEGANLTPVDFEPTFTAVDYDPFGEGPTEPGLTAGDFGRSVMSGGAAIGSGAGWLAEQIGRKTGLEGLEEAGTALRERSDESGRMWREEMGGGYSPGAREVQKQTYLKENPDALLGYELGDAGWDKTFMMLGESLLGTAAGGIAGRALTGGLKALPGVSAGVAAALGYSAGEALVAAPSAGAGAEEEVRSMEIEDLEDHVEYQALVIDGTKPEDAKEILARAAGGDAAFMTAISTAVLSGPFGRALDSIAGGEGQSLVGGLIKGAGTEAAQEAFQSGAEQISTNLGLKYQADTDRGPFEGVPEAVVGGAAAGGVMGGGMGALAGAYEERRLQNIEDRERAAEDAARAAEMRGGDALDQEIAKQQVYQEWKTPPSAEDEAGLAEAINLATEQRSFDQVDPFREPLPVLSDEDLGAPSIPAREEIEKAVEQRSYDEAAPFREPLEPLADDDLAEPGISAREEAEQAEKIDAQKAYREAKKGFVKRQTTGPKADPRKQELQQWVVSQLGPIDLEEAEEQGLDPAILNAKSGGKRIFKPGGRSFESAAERAAEDGFFGPGEEIGPNTLLDKITRSLSGEDQFTPEGFEDEAARQYAQQQMDEAQERIDQFNLDYDEEIDNPPPALTDIDEGQKELFYTMQEAEAVGVPEETIDSLLGSSVEYADASKKIRQEIDNEKAFRNWLTSPKGDEGAQEKGRFAAQSQSDREAAQGQDADEIGGFQLEPEVDGVEPERPAVNVEAEPDLIDNTVEFQQRQIDVDDTLDLDFTTPVDAKLPETGKSAQSDIARPTTPDEIAPQKGQKKRTRSKPIKVWEGEDPIAAADASVDDLSEVAFSLFGTGLKDLDPDDVGFVEADLETAIGGDGVSQDSRDIIDLMPAGEEKSTLEWIVEAIDIIDGREFIDVETDDKAPETDDKTPGTDDKTEIDQVLTRIATLTEGNEKRIRDAVSAGKSNSEIIKAARFNESYGGAMTETGRGDYRAGTVTIKTGQGETVLKGKALASALRRLFGEPGQPIDDYPKPNKAGVYSKSDAKVISMPGKNSPAKLYVIEVLPGVWINSIEVKTPDSGTSGPLKRPRGIPGEEWKEYETEIDAINAGLSQIDNYVGRIGSETKVKRDLAGLIKNWVAGETAKASQLDIDAKANEAATSPDNDLPEPSDAQIDKKGHINIKGLDISVENPKGSTRTGKRADGSTWSHEMQSHYGYIKNTVGNDGDQVDVFVGPDVDSENAFVIDQMNDRGDKGGFDEHKIMLGYSQLDDAVEAYLENYDDDWGVGYVATFDISELKEWLEFGDLNQPVENHQLSVVPSKGISAPARSADKEVARIRSAVRNSPKETELINNYPPVDELSPGRVTASADDIVKPIKDQKKYLARLEEALESRLKRFEEDKKRYTDLRERGVNALSEFDLGGSPESAYDGLGTALLLKANHVRYAKSQVDALRKAINKAGGGLPTVGGEFELAQQQDPGDTDILDMTLNEEMAASVERFLAKLEGKSKNELAKALVKFGVPDVSGMSKNALSQRIAIMGATLDQMRKHKTLRDWDSSINTDVEKTLIYRAANLLDPAGANDRQYMQFQTNTSLLQARLGNKVGMARESEADAKERAKIEAESRKRNEERSRIKEDLKKPIDQFLDDRGLEVAPWWDEADPQERGALLDVLGYQNDKRKASWVNRTFLGVDKKLGVPQEVKAALELYLPTFWGDQFLADPVGFSQAGDLPIDPLPIVDNIQVLTEINAAIEDGRLVGDMTTPERRAEIQQEMAAAEELRLAQQQITDEYLDEDGNLVEVTESALAKIRRFNKRLTTLDQLLGCLKS